MNNKYRFFATAPRGVEDLLVNELISLGAENVKQSKSGAKFQGALEMGYKACLWLRTANRVLLPLQVFTATDENELYQKIKEIDWSEHMNADNTLAVNFYASKSFISHSRYGTFKVKDAIVDQFRERYGNRPSVETETPDLRIDVYMNKNEVTVSIDLSGASLHKRGYRVEKGAAPLKENLAAALLIRAGWPEISRRGGALMDPMCGAGTLPIEAALIAANSAPGMLRRHFGFLKWKKHDCSLWNRLLEEAERKEIDGLASLPPIIGYDSDPRSVKKSIHNSELAGLPGLIHFEKRELADLTPHPKAVEKRGLVIINPPYGRRIGETEELFPLYSGLGSCLKKYFNDWDVSLFTGNPELGKKLGIRAKKKYTLFNGPIECSLLNFSIQPDNFVTQDQRTRRGNIVVSRRKATGGEIEMFKNRLLKNISNLSGWLRQNEISCYRVYDKDIPEYAVTIDIYGSVAHVQEYKAPDTVDPDKANSRLEDILSVLPELLGIQVGNIFLKVRERQRGKTQYQKNLADGDFFEVFENQNRFLVNFSNYLDTGLFLDHRITREKIAELSRGKRFLNLFCYTGTATVYAARGGASSTTSVDSSKTYLNWAKRNMALNGFGVSNHTYVRAECAGWLDSEKGEFDLIFLDPPTFSNSKTTGVTFDLRRDYKTLIDMCVDRLSRNGELIFSNNYKRFKMDSSAFPTLSIKDISKSTLPKDFRRTPRIHSCWTIRRK